MFTDYILRTNNKWIGRIKVIESQKITKILAKEKFGGISIVKIRHRFQFVEKLSVLRGAGTGKDNVTIKVQTYRQFLY